MTTNKADLLQFYSGKITLWRFQAWFEHAPITFIAPPWLNNSIGKSCIPYGLYNVVPHNTEDHKDTFRLLNVPDRDGILIHPYNYACDVVIGKEIHKSESEGCFGPGLNYDLVVPMVRDSVKAMNILRENIEGNWSIEVHGPQL